MAAVTTRPTWTFGNYLWKSRTDADLEQKEMASKLGVSRQLVARWEKGESFPTTRQLQVWAEITAVELGWLIEPLEASRWIAEAWGDDTDAWRLNMLEGYGNAHGHPLDSFADASGY